MNDEDYKELLIRVDQNVINILEWIKTHTAEDKEIHKAHSDAIEELHKEVAYRKGMGRVVTLIWGFLGAALGAKYGRS